MLWQTLCRQKELIEMIIHSYSTRSMQHNLGVLTPPEQHELYPAAAKAASNLQAAGRETCLLFHCPLDGVRFKSSAGTWIRRALLQLRSKNGLTL